MTKPKVSDEEPQPPVPVAKSPFRPLSRRQRLATRLAEAESPVQRPGTPLFRASPLTIGSAVSAEDTLVWTPGDKDDEPA